MTTKTIDISKNVYEDLAGSYKATPRKVLETVLCEEPRLGRQWTDLDLATKDYINRVDKALAILGGTISDDGMTYTYTKDAPVDIYVLLARVKHIDTKTILMSHPDDGYVVNPYGRMYDPGWWDVLTSMMDPHIASTLSDQMAPCTCQAFADAYAAKHQGEYGEEWEPYKEYQQF